MHQDPQVPFVNLVLTATLIQKAGKGTDLGGEDRNLHFAATGIRASSRGGRRLLGDKRRGVFRCVLSCVYGFGGLGSINRINSRICNGEFSW